MPPHTAARGLRRAELITAEPVSAVAFHQKLLGWLPQYAESGFDCWVGERQCASIRAAKSGEPRGWRPIFAGAAHDGSLTGPDETQALVSRGRAQHGPWAPGPRAGELRWIELFAADAERADTFWSDTLRWTVLAGSEDTATYAADGRPVATRTSRRGTGRRWGWLCYFAVEDFDQAADRVRRWDGQVFDQVSHSLLGDVLVIADPGGAVCALTRSTRAWGAAHGSA